MKTFFLLSFLLITLVSFSQKSELSNKNYLLEQYNLNIRTELSYTQMTSPIKYGDGKYFTVVSMSGDITSPVGNYSPRGDNSVLFLWDAKKGDIIKISEIGDDINRFSIQETQLTSDGRVFVYGYAYLSASNNNITIGNQTFDFRTDTLPGYLSAFYDIENDTWENVNFYYVGDRNARNYIDSPKHIFCPNGEIYFCGSFTAPYIIINNDTIIKGSVNSYPFFVSKLNSDFTKKWSKQCSYLTQNTSLYNLTFAKDNSDNLYIAGGIGYIYGQISFDGVIVKNDTILDEYDYTYTDLFLYKLNSDGNVQFGKTYLFRGTEQLSQMIVRNDGNLYLCGDYNNQFIAPGGTFPASDGGLYYNNFIAKVNSANGNFDWGYSLPSSMYYQDRLRQIRKDDNDDLYFAGRFKSTQISFMGNTFSKRTDHASASQVLFAKISKDGAFNWGRVLGATTSYPDVIEHQTFSYWNVDTTNMYLSVQRQSYGTNKIFEWGDSLVATTSITSGFFGNTVVISTDSGNVKYNYGKVLASICAIDSVDYFGINSDFMEYNVCRLTNKTTSLKGTVLVNGDTLKSNLYTSIQLLSLNKAEIGAIKGYGALDTNGNYEITSIPHGEYIVQAIPYDSTLTLSYYKYSTPSDWANADTVDLNESKENIDITVLKVLLPAGSSEINGEIKLESALNPGVSYYMNVQVMLYNNANPAQLIAFVRPYKYENSTYFYSFTNIPSGTYKVVVEYPFSTTVDTAEVIINTANQIVDNVNYKIIKENIYKEGNPVLVSVINDENIKVYLDNSSNNIYIKNTSNKNNTVYLFDTSGQLLFEKQIYENASINIDNLSRGIYIVKIDNITRKIVKF